MANKIVSLPVIVPAGKYCWEWTGDKSICEHYDNEGGSSRCMLLGLSLRGKKDKDGILKAKECADLKDVA